MRLTDLAGQDPDHLPYRVFTPLGDPVAVHFEPLTAADTPELNGPRWQGARFLPMWQQNTSSDAALKLVIGKSQSKEIEGIIKPGEVNAGNTALRNSIIEAAPVNQVAYRTTGRYLRGVGRVLVARLIIASWLQGGDGSVSVYAVGPAQDFCLALGFTPLKVANRFLLKVENANAVLAAATEGATQ